MRAAYMLAPTQTLGRGFFCLLILRRSMCSTSIESIGACGPISTCKPQVALHILLLSVNLRGVHNICCAVSCSPTEKDSH